MIGKGSPGIWWPFAVSIDNQELSIVLLYVLEKESSILNFVQPFNYHTHTYRCGHALGCDEDYVHTAIKSGFTALGFSEHIQFRALNGCFNRINYEDFSQYFQDIHLLQAQYDGQIRIYAGLEAEFIPEYLADLFDLRACCDYFILGQHRGGIRNRLYESCCSDRNVLQYANDIDYAIRTGLFCIIAHPDFFMQVRNTWSTACSEASWQICELARDNNCPLELNLKGTRGSRKIIDGRNVYPYPFRSFWEVAEQTQAPVIWGLDAHGPADFFFQEEYKRVQEIIAGLSLNFLKDFTPHMNCAR